MLRMMWRAVKLYGPDRGCLAEREGLGASEPVAVQARPSLCLLAPSVKNECYLHTRLVIENYQRSGWPRWWEMLCLSQEWSVGILRWQLKESVSVLHATSLWRSEQEPRITVRRSFSLKSLFINFPRVHGHLFWIYEVSAWLAQHNHLYV